MSVQGPPRLHFEPLKLLNFDLMRIRAQLLTLMRIRIQLPKLMRHPADVTEIEKTVPSPGQCLDALGPVVHLGVDVGQLALQPLHSRLHTTTSMSSSLNSFGRVEQVTGT
jgi:hypothetical protein